MNGCASAGIAAIPEYPSANQHEMETYPYFQYLEKCNSVLAQTLKYHLYPGMQFRSTKKWWPDAGRRLTPHEGVDLCYYTCDDGAEKTFTPDILVPVLAPGKIYAICDDFLGQTVFLDHEFDTATRFLSVYAHIVPLKTTVIGKRMQKGEVIGSLADTSGRKNRMPAHLHLSILRVEKDLQPRDFSWELICNLACGELLDPLEVIQADKLEYHRLNHWKEKMLKEFPG